jgi:hypothetical protein
MEKLVHIHIYNTNNPRIELSYDRSMSEMQIGFHHMGWEVSQQNNYNYHLRLSTPKWTREIQHSTLVLACSVSLLLIFISI